MSTRKRDLNALLGSRICHDVISPLSAIGNGVELLTMSGMANSPELQLIAESVQHASARVRFMRVAFGAATSDQHLSHGEIIDILRAIGRPRRIDIDWTPKDDLRRTEVKLTFLLLQCFETAMPRGGTIAVRREGPAWRLDASASRTRNDPQYWDLLQDPEADAEVNSSMVHFAIAQEVARALDRRITAEVNEQTIAARF